jgi:hypothetical protein
MQLTIEGTPRQFEPIKAFRAKHDLPPEFGVALFEPKDYNGLGRIDRAGADLNSVRATVLDAIPAKMALRDWLNFIPDLTDLFRRALEAINLKVGLHDVEIEYAAAGFADVCQAVVYAKVRGAEMPFEAIYGMWLDQTVRVSQTVHRYGGWDVQIVTHAYGRAGMIVREGSETHYVSDSTLGCPADGYMATLLADVSARILASPR